MFSLHNVKIQHRSYVREATFDNGGYKAHIEVFFFDLLHTVNIVARIAIQSSSGKGSRLPQELALCINLFFQTCSRTADHCIKR